MSRKFKIDYRQIGNPRYDSDILTNFKIEFKSNDKLAKMCMVCLCVAEQAMSINDLFVLKHH